MKQLIGGKTVTTHVVGRGGAWVLIWAGISLLLRGRIEFRFSSEEPPEVADHITLVDAQPESENGE